MGDHSMMMGDLVLLDAEVHAVVTKLMEENLEITPIHHHLINETPTINYIHYHGEVNATELARKIKAVSEALFGDTCKQNGTLLQYPFPSKEKLTETGMDMPPAMGMATAINFQMDGKSVASFC
ncbi:MAG: DUF1259 domain-containing protein [Ferruginibacter sp.]